MLATQKISAGTYIEHDLMSQLDAIGVPSWRPRHSFLFYEGDTANGVFVLHSGEVRLVFTDAPHDVTLQHVGRDAFLGLSAVLSGQPHSFTAEVLETCTFTFLPRRELLRVLHNDTETCFSIVKKLTESLQELRQVKAQRICPRSVVRPRPPKRSRRGVLQ